MEPDGDGGAREERVILPVIEEFLHVEKRAVVGGGYRLRKRVDTRTATVDELLRNYKVEIERVPVNAPLGSDDIPEPRYEGDTLVIPVIEEVIVTEKRLVLTEEIRVTRVHGTHRQPQTVELRKEHIEIERLEPPSPTEIAAAESDDAASAASPRKGR
ncbi:MAG TPA: YsnF/AvaK domain-containing protein [Caldimonas sp.]|nr:YsnF/AvaK domain-containing protein [Caldimonas sp.]HEX2540144.1 YsnF/AvaK domain-containing protein [Caldimonas sp.]